MLFWLAVDVLGALMLFGAGLLGLASWRGWRGQARGSSYWLLAGIGLVCLAIDERLSIHERAGARLYDAGVPTPFGLNHLDDAILMCLALTGLIVTLAYVPELLRHRRVLPPLFAGALLTGAALGVDGLAPLEGNAPRIEELLELAGQSFFLLAFWRRWSESPLPLPAVEPGLEAAVLD